MADLSFSEKIADVYMKINAVSGVLWGILPGGPFRFGTEQVRGHPVRVFKNLPAGVGDYYKYWFKKWGNKDWLVYENQRYTYKQALQMYQAFGAELIDTFHIKKGDKVGICMRNYPELLLAFLAITSVGGVAVPLNAMWKSEELEYAVQDSGCKVMVVDQKSLELCRPFYAKLGLNAVLVRGKQNDLTDKMWDQVIANGSNKKPYRAKMQPEDECMIMYTSGTTGFPKGVVHTQRSVGTAMKIGELATVVSPETNSVLLMAVPLFHITALCPIGLFSIPAGSTIIMMHKWDAGKGLEVIAKEKVTRFTGVPTMMKDLMDHPNFDPEKIKTLKGVVAGGAPVPPSQVAQMRKKTKNIESAQGYGLTESMALGTVNKGADYLRHPKSCGRPIPLMVEVAIKDVNDGKLVKEGGRGEVCLRGAMLMKCYHNKPEATAKAIDSEGFFHSGDIGKMEGGFLYILDRMKDLIIRGGENIDCSEVEAGISSHPNVRECSVFGLPDPRLGEVVGAAVWCSEETDAQAICDAAAKNLAKFKVPLAINIFFHKDPLPKGATGKIDKKGLRDHYGAIVEKRPIKSAL